MHNLLYSCKDKNDVVDDVGMISIRNVYLITISFYQILQC